MSTFDGVITSVVNAQRIPLDELEKTNRIMETPFDELLMQKRLDLTEYRKEHMSYDVMHDKDGNHDCVLMTIEYYERQIRLLEEMDATIQKMAAEAQADSTGAE